MEKKAERVNELVSECLNGSADGALVVESVMRTFGFSPEKIAAHKDEIRALLDDMPDSFHAGKGGGMTFLNLCMDRHGEQWAEHPTMEALIALGQAAGMASFPMPRSMWDVLPGGVPYVTFNTASA